MNVTPAKTVSKPADITSVKSVSKPGTPAKINSPKSSPNSNATDVSKTPNKSEKVKTDNAKKRPQDFVAENDERTHKKIKSSSDLLEDNDESKEGMNSSDKASLAEEHNKDHDSLGKKDSNDDGDDKIAKPSSTKDTKQNKSSSKMSLSSGSNVNLPSMPQQTTGTTNSSNISTSRESEEWPTCARNLPLFEDSSQSITMGERVANLFAKSKSLSSSVKK